MQTAAGVAGEWFLGKTIHLEDVNSDLVSAFVSELFYWELLLCNLHQIVLDVTLKFPRIYGRSRGTADCTFRAEG